MFSLYVVCDLARRAPSGRTAGPASCACDQPWSLCGPDVDPRDLVRSALRGRPAADADRQRRPQPRQAQQDPDGPELLLHDAPLDPNDLLGEYKTPLGRGLGLLQIFERIERIAAIGDRTGLLAGRGRGARAGGRLDGRGGARGLARRGREPVRPARRGARLDGLAPRLGAERRPATTACSASSRGSRRPRGCRMRRSAVVGLPRRGDRADGEPAPGRSCRRRSSRCTSSRGRCSSAPASRSAS